MIKQQCEILNFFFRLISKNCQMYRTLCKMSGSCVLNFWPGGGLCVPGPGRSLKGEERLCHPGVRLQPAFWWWAQGSTCLGLAASWSSLWPLQLWLWCQWWSRLRDVCEALWWWAVDGIPSGRGWLWLCREEVHVKSHTWLCRWALTTEMARAAWLTDRLVVGILGVHYCCRWISWEISSTDQLLAFCSWAETLVKMAGPEEVERLKQEIIRLTQVLITIIVIIIIIMITIIISLATFFLGTGSDELRQNPICPVRTRASWGKGGTRGKMPGQWGIFSSKLRYWIMLEERILWHCQD